MLALPQIEEPEYDWTEADLNEAHQDALDQKAAQELDYLLDGNAQRAALIAAAPELLEALKAVENTPQLSANIRRAAATRLANAAIAKAEGRA